MIAELKIVSQTGRRRRRQKGFGLVETVAAVCVLGIMTAIGVPAISKITDGSKDRKHQRVAQEFSMVANNAMAAGCREVAGAGSVAEALELLVSGVSGEGVFSGTSFQLPNVSVADQNAAARHLLLEDGILIYRPRAARGGRSSF